MTDANRRAFLGALGTAAAGIAGCLGTGGEQSEKNHCPSYDPVTSSTTDWTSRMGNPAGTAQVAAEAAPGTDLSLDWTKDLPLDRYQNEPRISTPIVADGIVYIHDGEQFVFAFDAESGTERWRARVRNPAGTPALGGRKVFVRTRAEVLGPDEATANIRALDAATGENRWSALDQAQTFLFPAGPVVADGTVYVMADVAAYALDPATGRVRWRYPTGLRSRSTPAVASGTVYIAGNDTYVRALSADDGSKQWETKLDTHIRCNMSVANGLVCTATPAGTVIALDATDGTERWRYQLPNGAVSNRTQEPLTVNTDGARVYVTTDGNLYALAADEGTKCWETEDYGFSVGGNWTNSVAAIADGTLYATTEGPEGITGYDAASGEVRQQWEHDDSFYHDSLSLADGALYIAGDGTVARIR